MTEDISILDDCSVTTSEDCKVMHADHTVRILDGQVLEHDIVAIDRYNNSGRSLPPFS